MDDRICRLMISDAPSSPCNGFTVLSYDSWLKKGGRRKFLLDRIDMFRDDLMRLYHKKNNF